MKNTIGNSVAITLFGESHGPYIGAVIDGLAPGLEINHEYIHYMLELRRPEGKISTPRKEMDEYQIVSGVMDKYTSGTPLTIIIPNENVKSSDYHQMKTIARPSHADYTAECKYHGFQDSRGGGHFSGRITAALVAAGAICRYALEQKGIYIGTHLKSCGQTKDREFEDILEDIRFLNRKKWAVLDKMRGQKMKEEILQAASEKDSLGGILETAIVGMPQGIGEPWFDSLEGMLSHMIFSIPAVKGIEFGSGFALAQMRGSSSADEMRIVDHQMVTTTNHNGGLNGGITNGMPIVFRTVIKPTPTIFKPLNSIDFKKNEETVLISKGRHDPAIVHRARVVQDAVSAIVCCDGLAMHFGTDWLR